MLGPQWGLAKKKKIHQLKVAHCKMLKDIKINEASLKSQEIIDDKNISIIQSFCKIWTHPYICTLEEDNELTINIKHKEEEDNMYRECYSQAKTLAEYQFPYHTANH